MRFSLCRAGKPREKVCVWVPSPPALQTKNWCVPVTIQAPNRKTCVCIREHHVQEERLSNTPSCFSPSMHSIASSSCCVEYQCLFARFAVRKHESLVGILRIDAGHLVPLSPKAEPSPATSNSANRACVEDDRGMHHAIDATRLTPSFIQ